VLKEGRDGGALLGRDEDLDVDARNPRRAVLANDLEVSEPASQLAGDDRSMASISRRRLAANARMPFTTSPPTAPRAYSIAATCGDASSNSSGLPMEN